MTSYSFYFHNSLDYVNIVAVPLLVPLMWRIWYIHVFQPDFARKTRRNRALCITEFWFGITALCDTVIYGLDDGHCVIKFIQPFNWILILSLLLLRLTRLRFLERIAQEKLSIATSTGESDSSDSESEPDGAESYFEKPTLERRLSMQPILIKYQGYLSDKYFSYLYVPGLFVFTLFFVIGFLPPFGPDTATTDSECADNFIYPALGAVLALLSCIQLWKIRNFTDYINFKKSLLYVFMLMFVAIAYKIATYTSKPPSTPYPNIYPYISILQGAVSVWYLAKCFYFTNPASFVLDSILTSVGKKGKNVTDESEDTLQLQTLLKIPKLRKYLREFMLRSFCIENLLFFIDCERFKKHLSLSGALEIYHMYIQDGAEFQVNISAEQKEEIEVELEDLAGIDPTSDNLQLKLTSLFDFSQLEVYNLMKLDTWPRFISSEFGVYCIQAFEKMVKKRKIKEDALAESETQENLKTLPLNYDPVTESVSALTVSNNESKLPRQKVIATPQISIQETSASNQKPNSDSCMLKTLSEESGFKIGFRLSAEFSSDSRSNSFDNSFDRSEVFDFQNSENLENNENSQVFNSPSIDSSNKKPSRQQNTGVSKNTNSLLKKTLTKHAQPLQTSTFSSNIEVNPSNNENGASQPKFTSLSLQTQHDESSNDSTSALASNSHQMEQSLSASFLRKLDDTDSEKENP